MIPYPSMTLLIPGGSKAQDVQSLYQVLFSVFSQYVYNHSNHLNVLYLSRFHGS